MSLNARQLRQAHALATHRSFSRAAEVLGVSQPTLSRGIQDLEQSLGVALFHRGRGGVEPTDFGWVFLEHAADVLVRLDDLERESRLVRGLQTGIVSVGFGPHAASTLVPAAAGDFAGEHPEVRLKLRIATWEVLPQWLRAREADLTVAEPSPTGVEDDLEEIARLPPLKVFVVARAGHPLCSRRGLRMEDVLAYPLVMAVRLPPRVLQPLVAAQERLSARGVRPAVFPALECPSLDLALRVVGRSDVLMTVTLDTAGREIQEGRVVPLLHEPWMTVGWAILRLRRRTLSPAATAFVDALRRAHEEARAEAARLEARFVRSRGPDPPAPGSSRRRARRRRGS